MNDLITKPFQLSIENVTVGYESTVVVHNAVFQLKHGQIGCLLGPSGCGKSTLLRAIAGFEPVLNGHISMEGSIISSIDTLVHPEKRHIGLVFQDLALFPHLTIAENIEFGIQKWPKKDRQTRTQQLLKLVGLDGMEKRYPHSLSGGQQQRIALARTIAPKPKLLLLDEPFSGLDAAMREELLPEVREILLQERMSAILVTHDQLEAFAMADTVAVMNHGKIIQCDTPFNIYHKPNGRFIGNFIGKGDYLPGEIIDNQSVNSPLGILGSSKPHNFKKSQRVEILIRPDDVLHNDDSELHAKIIEKQFRGSHFLYRVELSSGHLLYCFASSHHDHAVGESIGITIDLDHLVMFEITPN